MVKEHGVKAKRESLAFDGAQQITAQHIDIETFIEFMAHSLSQSVGGSLTQSVSQQRSF